MPGVGVDDGRVEDSGRWLAVGVVPGKVGGNLMEDDELLAPEEEGLLLAGVVDLRDEDGTADGCSRRCSACRAGRVREVGLGVQGIVAQELPCGAVEAGCVPLLVCSRTTEEPIRLVFSAVVVLQERGPLRGSPGWGRPKSGSCCRCSRSRYRPAHRRSALREAVDRERIVGGAAPGGQRVARRMCSARQA